MIWGQGEAVCNAKLWAALHLPLCALLQVPTLSAAGLAKG